MVAASEFAVETSTTDVAYAIFDSGAEAIASSHTKISDGAGICSNGGTVAPLVILSEGNAEPFNVTNTVAGGGEANLSSVNAASSLWSAAKNCSTIPKLGSQTDHKYCRTSRRIVRHFYARFPIKVRLDA